MVTRASLYFPDPIPNQVSKKLDDVLDAKNGAIKDLQYELARVTKVRRVIVSIAIGSAIRARTRHQG